MKPSLALLVIVATTLVSHGMAIRCARGETGNRLAASQESSETTATAPPQTGEPLIRRLDPTTRGKVIFALAGLLMLGMLMVALTWLMFRMVWYRIREADRIAQKQRQRVIDEDDWARKPLVERPEDA